MNSIELLQWDFPLGERVMTVHTALFSDGDGFVLVDTGMPGQLAVIRESLARLGLAPDRLNAVILTHQDIDHIGSLPQIAAERAVDVYAHPLDKPYIECEKTFIKLPPERREMMLAALPAAERERFNRYYSASSPEIVTRLLQDGERLPFGGGVTAIHTPGHTPGHTSLYHHASKTLIAGDAMTVSDGELKGPNPPATPDLDAALASLRKLAAYDIETVVCYHGGIYRDRPNERIARIAAGEA